MNRLLKLLGYRDRDYRGQDFHVRIEPISREVISIIYTCHDKTLNLDGEFILGPKRIQGIRIVIPFGTAPSAVTTMTRDLKQALRSMEYGYVIVQVSSGEHQRYEIIEKSRGF